MLTSNTTSSTMDLKTYFQRIGLPDLVPGTFTPSLSVLRELYRHHVFSIPFECLSSHIGEKVHLDPSWIYEKMVLRRRGGFCYEHNGLFWWVLRELGFQTQILSARVLSAFTGTYGLPFDHMLLAVELEGRRWLCDVGFGGEFIPLLPLEAGSEEKLIYGEFRLQVEGDNWYLEKKQVDLWKVLFKFTLEERRFEEFNEMCVYHQTSPYSALVLKSICILALPQGQLELVGYKLISEEYMEDGGRLRTTQEVIEDQIPDLLKDKFGIVLGTKLIPKDESVPVPPSM